MTRKARWGRITGASLLASVVLAVGVSSLIPEAKEHSLGDNFKEVIVWEGDTLWNVAKENDLNNRGDIRDILYEDIFIQLEDDVVPYHEFNQELFPGTLVYIKEDAK